MNKNLKNKLGFSLIESVVAGVVLTTVFVGVYATVGSIKRPVVETNQKLIAANLGRQILEDLRSKVDARDWSTAGTDLELGTHGPFTVGAYTYSYEVTDVDGTRKVDLTITW